MRGRRLAIAGTIVLALYAFRHPLELRLLRHDTAHRPDTAGEPVQTADGKPPFDTFAGGRRYRLTPRFRWDESARVVGERAYHLGAAGALIPEDLALAWGPVLAAPYAGKISYSQFSRFYFWRTSDGSLDRGAIVRHTANTHVIPATARLRSAVRCVAEGDDVRLEGWLVDVVGVDDPRFHWTTSTTREDEGPASCETVREERARAWLTPFDTNTAAWPRVIGVVRRVGRCRCARGDAEVVNLQDIGAEERRHVGKRAALVLHDPRRAAGEQSREGKREN
jgi:hypothetical protein